MRTKANIKKLPKWAQNIIYEQEQVIAAKERELINQAVAHSVLFDHEHWFTIPGPPPVACDEEVYRLFYLSRDGAHPACSLYKGDILLVGRKRNQNNPQPKGQP